MNTVSCVRPFNRHSVLTCKELNKFLAINLRNNKVHRHMCMCMHVCVCVCVGGGGGLLSQNAKFSH